MPALMALASPIAHADDQQDVAAIVAAANDYLANELRTYGNKAQFQVGKIDQRLILPRCEKIEVSLPSGNRLVGNSSVKVRCAQGANWAVNVPVSISLTAPYLVASRPLPSGHVMTEADFQKREGELSQLPPTVVLDPQLAIGRTLVGGLAVGAPLRSDQLRAAFAVKANEFVKVIAHGNGFEVTSEGRALANAAEGQKVSVKMASGSTVHGVAKSEGVVEIQY